MFDIVVIASFKDPIRKRIQEIAKDYSYTFCEISGPEEFIENQVANRSGFIVCSATQVLAKNEIAGMTQVVRQFAKDAFIVMVVDGKMTPEDAEFVKRSGANLILLEGDALNSPKIDLVASQKIRYKYLPIKISEFRPDTKLTCDLFHLMPLNKKYFKLVNKGQIISREKFDKLTPFGEIYIRKEEIDLFAKYVQENHTEEKSRVTSKCRAQLLSLTVTYIDLILIILDQSEYASYLHGKELYEHCEKLAGEVLSSLSATPDPWDIINNTALGEFGSIERGPSVAAYAGLLSFHSKVGNPTEMMVAALLMNVGLLDLAPKIVRKLRNGIDVVFTEEEKQDFEKHPIISINRVLGRKLQVTEAIKQAILGSHERIDGEGFPHGWRGEKVPRESMLLQLAEIIDQRSLIKLGHDRPQILQVREQIVKQELQTYDRFSADFTQKVISFVRPSKNP